MCGIVGYIGKKEALPILLRGLTRLEYRGYDSAGVAIQNNGVITRIRSVGKVSNLAEKTKQSPQTGSVGIAHTRWATHGGVTEQNAHPHSDCSGKIVIVHNGIIENYRELRNDLKNHQFTSETDTEVLAHLIEKNYHGDLRAALQEALKKVRGTYGVVVMHSEEPGKIVAARLGSPLAVGIGEGEYFIASDTSPMLAYTHQVVFLDDGEVAEISASGLKLFNLRDELVEKAVRHVDWNESEAQLGGWPHFMLKEIFDQPQVLQDALRGRLVQSDGTAHLGGLNMDEAEMQKINRIILLGCGTSSYAAWIGKFAFERLAGLPTNVEISSEFRYSDPIIGPDTLVFGVSQSGETADTLAALREAKRKGAVVRGIVNVVGSSIARECAGGTYIHAGPELAVASTKAFTNMAAVLIMYALQFGRQRRLSVATGERVVKALLEIPEKIKLVLDQSEQIKKIAKKYSNYKNFFFLGRGMQYPAALEGSLKLKEISYIHSEAYQGGEMKHGPIALVSPEFPVVAILTKDQWYDKMRSNIEEVRARKAPMIIIATLGDTDVRSLGEDVIYIPETMELLGPLLSTVVLQLFAYHMAVELGKDVDRPRNLAKSVTVE